MNRQELVRLAEEAGVDSSCYSLQGGMPPEQYVLSAVDGGWSVYFSERQHRVNEMKFDTEDEACSELLLRLVRDPTTRRR